MVTTVTLPLRVGKKEHDIFEGRMKTAQRIYNVFLTEYTNRVLQMKQSVEFRRLIGERRTAIAEGHLKGQIKPGFKPSPNPRILTFANVKDRNAAWKVLREKFDVGALGKDAYSKADGTWLKCLVKEQEQSFGPYSLGSALIRHSLQKRAGQTVEKWMFAKGGKPKRKSRLHPLNTVESSSSFGAKGINEPNRDTLRFEPKTLTLTWVGASGEHPVTARAIIPTDDFWARKNLKHSRILVVRVVRKTIYCKAAWFVQLVVESEHPELKRIGAVNGIVGLDLGTKHIAVATPDGHGFIAPLVSSTLYSKKQTKKLQKKMARELRRLNPDATKRNADGKPAGFKRGIRLAKNSSWHRNCAKVAEIARYNERSRTVQHGVLVNRVLKYGTTVHLEDLEYKSWQANFGKTTQFSAPGRFIDLLTRRAALYGGSVEEISTWTTTMSQLCHACAAKTKSSELSKSNILSRTSSCICGRTPLQRDLYSAFLAAFADKEKAVVLIAEADKAWQSRADQALQRVWQQSINQDAEIFAQLSKVREPRKRPTVRKHTLVRESKRAQSNVVGATVPEGRAGELGRKSAIEQSGGVLATQTRSKRRTPGKTGDSGPREAVRLRAGPSVPRALENTA